MNKVHYHPINSQQIHFTADRTPPKETLQAISTGETVKKHQFKESSFVCLEAEYKSIINGYEFKIKNMGEEFKRSKVELERKIIEITKQKHQFQTLLQNQLRQRKLDSQNCKLKGQNNQNNDFIEANSKEMKTLQKNWADAKNEITIKVQYIAKLQKQRSSLKQINSILANDTNILLAENQRISGANLQLKSQLKKIQNQIVVLKQSDSITLKIPNQDSIRRLALSPPNSLRNVSRSNSRNSKQKPNSIPNPSVQKPHNPTKITDPSEKIKRLESHLDTANRKIKALNQLIDETNKKSMANNLSILNQKYRNRF